MEATLPYRLYLDAGVFAAERERIFAREWTVVGRADDTPEPGDWFLGRGRRRVGARRPGRRRRAARASTTCAVTAARSWSVRRAREPGTRGRVLRCPYHSWTYGLDGGLRRAPFLAETDLDRDGFGLHPVGVDDVGRFRVRAPRPGTGARRSPSSSAPIPDALRALSARDLRRGAQLVYEVAAELEGARGELQRVLPLRPGAPGAVRPRPRVPARRRRGARLGARHPAPRRRVHVHDDRARATARRSRTSTTTSACATRVSSSTRTCCSASRADHVASFMLIAARPGPHDDRVRPAVPSRRDRDAGVRPVRRGRRSGTS